MSISLLAITGVALLLPERLNFTILGVGTGLWGVMLAYGLGLRLVFFDQRFVAAQESGSPRKTDFGPAFWKAVAVYVVSAGLIFFAGPRLAHAAHKLAEQTGLGNTFFGTVFLPLCTTLPELVAGITAIRLRAFHLVVGNAFGSISFNLLLLVPIDVAYSGSLMVGASETHLVTCLAAIGTTAIAVMGQLYHAERRRRIVEPDATLILLLVILSFVLLYLMR